ncbi:MAG TPA: hypothetical protein VM536_04085 [Chloroflexia bacterium]|nr:hypothetical protein [Chloroflexia bacterium]
MQEIAQVSGATHQETAALERVTAELLQAADLRNATRTRLQTI